MRREGKSVRAIKRKIDMLRQCDVSEELLAVIRWGGIMSAAAFVISLCFGFDVTMLLGLFVGWAYLCFCYIYLANTICSIARMTDINAAKTKMHICYAVRFIGLFLLCWIGFETDSLNVVGLLIPQFFPKIIMYIQFVKKGKSNGRS